MKILVIYYSRTGTTRKIAEKLSADLSADIEEIIDTKDRSGAMGYIFSGRDSMKKRLTEIKPLEKNLSEYDLILIGTPIWAWTVSVPVRTFLEKYKDNLKRVAFFCTMGGSGDKKAFSEMEKISGKKPTAVLALTTKEVVQNNFAEKLGEFQKQISAN